MTSTFLWPELRFEDWKEGCQTFHRWLQIVGKIRISKSPWINHSWQTPLYLTSRGMTTSLIHEKDRAFSIEFDLIDQVLRIEVSDGKVDYFPLVSESVASFHGRCFMSLASLGIHASIKEIPNELPDAIPLNQDDVHHTYDPETAKRFWQVMLQVERVMQIFRSKFLGKVSPIHLFWGSMDLAVTRFSGRRAPEHPGGIPHLPDLVTREAYSHEVSSCGFWPGTENQYPNPAFYSYAYPTPTGFSGAKIAPKEAFWHDQMREFLLPYDAVRGDINPEQKLLDFFQSTYEAAANLGGWDRPALEESVYLKQLQDIYGPRELRRVA
jgi:hypothetical protein